MGVAGCGPEPAPRNAILIVVDTLRWDHVGAYGHSRPVTPSIDGLAAEGTRYERAYSPAPWTKPAVASLLTGLYPSSHGVETMAHSLAPGQRTIAEILSENGFRTAAVVSHILLAEKYENGFAQGFDAFLEAASKEVVSTPRVTDDAVALLRGFAAESDTSDGRFFLFVHYFDPHFEYLPHPEYAFAPSRAGRLDGSRGILELREMRDSFTPDEINFLVDRYDEEIRFTDDGIGRLLSTLEELGLADETLVVFTADHGEEFLERGWLGHTRTLYEELVRVPLVVRNPASRENERVVTHPVSTVSITPSLLEWLGIEAGITFEAPPLRDATRSAAVRSEVAWRPASELHKLGPVSKTALIEERYKLVRDASGKVEIYDLEEDPGETRPLADLDPEVRRRLHDALRPPGGSR